MDIRKTWTSINMLTRSGLRSSLKRTDLTNHTLTLIVWTNQDNMIRERFHPRGESLTHLQVVTKRRGPHLSIRERRRTTLRDLQVEKFFVSTCYWSSLIAPSAVASSLCSLRLLRPFLASSLFSALLRPFLASSLNCIVPKLRQV